MMFNESMKWSEMLAKKKAFYNRMETDHEFRMQQVDKKLLTVNALSGFDKYMRYKGTVIEHNINGEHVDTFLIGLHGQIKKY